MNEDDYGEVTIGEGDGEPIVIPTELHVDLRKMKPIGWTWNGHIGYFKDADDAEEETTRSAD